MFERNVFDEYKLYCEQRFTLGKFEGFSVKNKHYFFVPVDDIEDQEMKEMIQMGNHLSANGDYEIATFVPTANNQLTGFIDGQKCVLFQLPLFFSRSKKFKSIGQQLALQHQRGKSFPKQSATHLSWSKLWEKRLSQLEMLYSDLTKQPKKTVFDEAFMISFPYYLGRTETAIQYIVDTELDFGRQLQSEVKTISHYQFSERTWLTLDDVTLAAAKNPAEFIYDFRSRDLAELMRTINEGEARPNIKIKTILQEYEKIEKLSLPAWRFIYGRLLFPISFFQTVEGYYRSMSDTKREELTEHFFDLFQQEAKTEQFLRSFHEEIVPRQFQEYVPRVDWLIPISFSHN